MTAPDFIIFGVEKSGSTSLYKYLRQHPEIFMSEVKEPNYFLADADAASRKRYESLFAGASPGQTTGEASVKYFQNSRACRAIRANLPEVRLIAVLRDPADRAFSHYNMLVTSGVVPKRPYGDVVHEAIKSGNFLNTGIPTSRYATPIKNYLDAFPKENLRIFLYELFRNDPQVVLREIFRFLGVNAAFSPDMRRKYNRSYVPRHGRLNQFVHRDGVLKHTYRTLLPETWRLRAKGSLSRINRVPVQRLDPDVRASIVALLYDDIGRTEEVLGTDLSSWRAV